MRWTQSPSPPGVHESSSLLDLLDWSTDVESFAKERALFVFSYSGDDPGLVSDEKYLFVTDDRPLTSSDKETLLARSTGRATVSSAPKEAVDLSWLTKPDPQAGASPHNLQALYRAIQHWLRSSDYLIVDELFRAADVALLPAETLTALLRYSFGARKKLPNWGRFLASVHQELERREMDAAALLYGLGAEERAQQAQR
jgi:hypothetical protein